MKINSLFLFIVLIGLFSSCANENSNKQDQDSVDLENADTGVVVIDDSNEIIYLVSTPGEIIEMLNEANLNYKPGLISDFTKAETYIVQKSQAINLGIYTADLGYCTYYDELNSSANLFFGIQELCDKLEVSNLLDHIQLNRVKKNLHTPDSVKAMAKEYNKVIYNHFIENNKKSILTLISTGGLVESLYLALNSIDKVDPKSEIAKAIAGQKYSFEVLRDFVHQQKEDEVVAAIFNDIQELDKVFSTIIPEKKERTKVENNKGKIVISGSNNLTINQRQYDELKRVITEIRNAYVNL